MKGRLDVIFIKSKSVKEIAEQLGENSAVIISKDSRPRINFKEGKTEVKRSTSYKCIIGSLSKELSLNEYNLHDVNTGKYYKGYTPVTIINKQLSSDNINDLKENGIKNLSKHVNVFILTKDLNKE